MNNGFEYRKRLVDEQLERLLSKFGAVLIKGPKWSGKTTTAEQLSKSIIYLQDPDEYDRYLKIAESKVSLLLRGDKPRLIDEWQTIPKLWDAVRHDVDRTKEHGLYILTGSNLLEGKGIKHSGAGRIARLDMRPMSLYESGESTGEISLRGLFDGAGSIEAVSPIDQGEVAELIVRGGWPSAVIDGDVSGEITEQYCEAILDSEIFVDGKVRDRNKMEMILRSLSRNISTSASNRRILKDITPVDEMPEGNEDDDSVWDEDNPASPPMGIDTLRRYLGALDDISVVEDMPAWMPKLRSEVAIRSSDTRYFTDPSIAAHFLDAKGRDLRMDPDTLGLLFENLVVRDIRIYAQFIGGRVFHYRDKNGLEVDSIIHLGDGRWGAIEVKLNPSRDNDGAKTLLALKEKVDVEERNKLAFMAVIVSEGFAYTRDDGVHVIPIGCLGP